jgi:hypothetical protein
VAPDQLRAAGFSWRKVSTLRDLAERMSDGRRPYRNLATSYLFSAAFEPAG